MKLRPALWGSCFFLLAQGAAADREKAAAAYKAATAAFAHGAFNDAAVLFETAFAEDARGGSIYNAGLAWQSAHDDARAADDFVRAVAFSDLSKELSDNAKVQLAKIEPTVAKLHVDGPPDAIVSVQHQTPAGAPIDTRITATSGRGSIPVDAYLAPGRYLVHATYSDGSTGDFPVNAAGGTPIRVDVTPHPAAPNPPAELPPPSETPEIRATGLLGPPTLGVGIGLIAAGAVAGGFAIGLGVATLDALNQYKSVNGINLPLATSDHDQTVNLQAWTNVMFVTALVLGAAGIVAVVTVHRVKLHATVGLGSLGLSGTF